MALQVGTQRGNLGFLSTSPLCPCSRSPLFSIRSKLSSSAKKFDVRLMNDFSHGICRLPKGLLHGHRVIMAVARAEPYHLDEEEAKEEANEGPNLLETEDIHPEAQHKTSQLKKRVLSGLVIGISGGGIVLAGGWVFTIAVAAAVFIAAREYFELVRSRGIAAGMTPPPRYVSRVCSVICALMPIWTLRSAM